MGRRKNTYKTENGLIRSKVTLTTDVWTILIRVGQMARDQLGVLKVDTDDQAGELGLGLLMKQVNDLLMDGDAKWLPDRTFARAIAQLRESNLGMLSSDEAGSINLDTLHRNTKLKSGFEGVYASGQGFRAMGKDITGKTIVVGSYPTAVEAAYRRQLYYRANNLAYGELETEMETWRKNSSKYGCAGLNDQQLIIEIKQHAQTVGTYDQIFGSRSCTIEPVFSKLPSRSEVSARALPAVETTTPPTGSPDGITPAGFEPGDMPPGWET